MSVLRGEANYDYNNGPMIDGRIPTSEFVEGYHMDDHSRSNAYGSWSNAAPTIPHDPQGLFLPHQDLEGGYAVMPELYIAMDYAPFQRKEKNWQLGILRSMRNVAPLGYDLPGGTIRAAYTDSVMKDPGNPVGTLTIAPKNGAAFGRMQNYSLPANFSQYM